jgi:hypothetical protein
MAGPEEANRPVFETGIRQLAKNYNLTYQLQISNPREQKFSSLTEALSIKKRMVVVVSPLLIFDLEQIIYQYPESHFIVLGQVPEDLQIPNLLAIPFHKMTIYKELGQRMAKMLQSPHPEKELGLDLSPGSLTPTPPPDTASSSTADKSALIKKPIKLGILAVYPTKKSREETESFVTGFSSLNNPALLIERELSLERANLSDLTPVVDEMYQAGVAVFLLKTYSLTNLCLEIIKNKGGRVIMETQGPTFVPAQTILLAIEEDYLASLQEALSQLARGKDKATFKNTNLSGKIKLNWHK